MKASRLCLVLAVILLSIGCKKEPSETTMLLCAAAEAGDIERVQTLTARGVDVNAKDRSTLTPLHYAARRGHKEIIELLRKYAKPVPQAR